MPAFPARTAAAAGDYYERRPPVRPSALTVGEKLHMMFVRSILARGRRGGRERARAMLVTDLVVACWPPLGREGRSMTELQLACLSRRPQLASPASIASHSSSSSSLNRLLSVAVSPLPFSLLFNSPRPFTAKRKQKSGFRRRAPLQRD